MAYAEATTVAVERSVAEIATLVRRNAGSQIAQLDDDDRYVIAFTMADRQVRFTVMFDPLAHKRFATDGRGSARDAAGRRKQWEQHRRQRMRAMLLVIRAKFESVDSGVETFEQAFLANVVMSTGETVYDRIAAPIAAEYQTGAPQLMLTGPRP
jgi:hypothetical protein